MISPILVPVFFALVFAAFAIPIGLYLDGLTRRH